jgi:hypothetical protein
MAATAARICCCMLFLFFTARSQDMKAVADDGRTVMLKSSGVWFYIDRSERTDTWATLRDSTKVRLLKDGSWMRTAEKGSVPDQSRYIFALPGRKGNTGAGGTPYRNVQYRYSIIPPKDWIVQHSSPDDLQWKLPSVLPKQKRTANNTMNVTTSLLRNKETLNVFADSYINGITRTGFRLGERGTADVGGRIAYWFTGTLVMMGLEFRAKTYLVVNGEFGYEISYTSGVEEFPMHMELFEETVQSFWCE